MGDVWQQKYLKKVFCAIGCVLSGNGKIHVPAGGKPYHKVVITTGLRFLSSQRLKQAFHNMEDFVRKQQVRFLVDGSWCLVWRPLGHAECLNECLQIQISRNPRNFSLYSIQFTKTHYHFSSSNIMWLSYISLASLQIPLFCLKEIPSAFLFSFNNWFSAVNMWQHTYTNNYWHWI